MELNNPDNSFQDLNVDSSHGSCNRTGQRPVAGSVENRTVGSHDLNTIQTEITEAENRGPLTGKPFFTCIVSKSYIQPPFQIVVPKWFAIANHLSDYGWATLSYNNKSWEVKYSGQPGRRFESGWKKFAIENSLCLDDGLVFELMDDKNLKFNVRILSGKIPDSIVGKVGGGTTKSPVLVE